MKLSNAIFKTFFLSLAIIANIHFAYAQQNIVPNGYQTYLDQNGKPLSSGKVFYYTGATGSTVPKTTYQDIGGTIPNTNPVTLNAAGRALVWGTGNYRQIVQDKNNNIIWDTITSAAGSGSGGGGIATGDGDLVGTIKPWAGMTAPNQYMFTYGQEVSRTTYSALFTAITSTQAIFCNSGSPVLSGLTSTANFWIGMGVEVNCVTGGASTVISKTSSSVTLAVNANLTINTNATFFPWGRGDGSTTFNLPDFRGLIPLGNNIMGGIASSNINDSYFGSRLAESSGGQGGGNTATLQLTNLPANITSSGSITGTAVPASGHLPQSNVTMAEFDANIGGGGTVRIPANNPTNSGTIIDATSLVVSGTASATSNNTGSSGNAAPFGIIPPTKTVNYIIKVTPDTNSATASGVTSLGGMTGDIACGTGLTCTGNIISSVNSNSNITILGNTTTYNIGQNNFVILRSNSSAAMSDLLPGIILTNNTSFTIKNNDPSALLAVQVSPGSITGSISGTIFIAASGLIGGSLAPGQHIGNTTNSIDPNTVIVSQLTGPIGGLGTYQVSISQTVGSGTINYGAALDNGLYNFDILGPTQSVTIYSNGTDYISISPPSRARLSSSVAGTLYFGNSGSDNNPCVLSSAPCKTIQRSIDIGQQRIDDGGGEIIYQAVGAPTTFTAGALFRGKSSGVGNSSGSYPFFHAVYLRGDPTTVSNYTINTTGTGTSCIQAIQGTYFIEGFTLICDGSSIVASNQSTIGFGVMAFGATGGADIAVGSGSSLHWDNNYTKTGAAVCHITVQSGGVVNANTGGFNVAMTTAVFSQGNYCIQSGGTINNLNTTQTGTATGPKFWVGQGGGSFTIGNGTSDPNTLLLGSTNGTYPGIGPANNYPTPLSVSQLTSCTAGVNFNSANTDNAISLALPTSFTRIIPFRVSISNASHTLVTATFGVFPTTAAGGTALVAGNTAITVSATADATLNNSQSTAALNTASFVGASLATPNTVYFRVGTAEGTAATGDVCLDYWVRP